MLVSNDEEKTPKQGSGYTGQRTIQALRTQGAGFNYRMSNVCAGSVGAP